MGEGVEGRAEYWGDVALIRRKGVPVAWLAGLLGLSINEVRRKTKGLPVLRTGKGGKVFYDPAEVMEHLVSPKRAIHELLRDLPVQELPPHLQHKAWAAVEKAQKVQLTSGHLWHTEEIIEMLVDVFSHLRAEILMTVDNIDREVGLDKAQRAALRGHMTNVVANIYRRAKEYQNAARPLRERLSEHPMLRNPHLPEEAKAEAEAEPGRLEIPL
jgi:hypothetical protein